MGLSRPNFSPKLEPIHRTRSNADSKHVRRYVAPLAFNKKKKHTFIAEEINYNLDRTFVSTNHFSDELYQLEIGNYFNSPSNRPTLNYPMVL